MQWRDGRRGQDGWGRYTRRRKWYRDAELVEVTPSTEITPIPTPKLDPVADSASPEDADTKSDGAPSEYAASIRDDTDASSTKSHRRRWFRKSNHGSDKGSTMTVASSSSVDLDRRSDEDDVHTPIQQQGRENEWGLGDDFRMQLG